VKNPTKFFFAIRWRLILLLSLTACGAQYSRAQTRPYILDVQRQALEVVESCRYCDSVRTAQGAVIVAQDNKMISLDSTRVNAEARAQAAQDENHALKFASAKDKQIMDSKEKENKRLRIGNVLLKIAIPVVAVATAVVTIIVKDKTDD
jgi:hypothetical protein